MGPISWVVFGALAGWVASLIAGNSKRQGCLMNILVGIIGAFLGGLLIEVLTGAAISFGWNWRSFGVAVLGSFLLLWLTGAARKR
jgi:uncharacterized membrane protein YeaQ/YmgE (transglycosylase-associated protein family)